MFENRFLKDYKVYEDLPCDKMQERYDMILAEWTKFLKRNDKGLVENRDYFVHQKNLFEIIRRCDERVLYYYIFHNLSEECEYKEVAILSFWINTLKPFMVINHESEIYSCPNEMFSLYLILSCIEGAFTKEFPTKEFHYPSIGRIKDILYDFKYCSLSREAMISFVETLADTYGVGIAHILNQKKS